MIDPTKDLEFHLSLSSAANEITRGQMMAIAAMEAAHIVIEVGLQDEAPPKESNARDELATIVAVAFAAGHLNGFTDAGRPNDADSMIAYLASRQVHVDLSGENP